MPVLMEAMEGGFKRPIFIEGVSGVGKSTVVQAAAEATGRELICVTEFSYGSESVGPGDLVAMDYGNPGTFRKSLDRLGAGVSDVVILGHPQFPREDNNGWELVDHKAQLAEVGIDVDLHRLGLMHGIEVSAYLKADGIEEEQVIRALRFGLGIAGHIDTILRSGEVEVLRLRALTVAKLNQILKDGGQFHMDPVERVETLIEKRLRDDDLRREIAMHQDRTLEYRLGRLLNKADHLLPNHDRTLEIYKEIFRFGDCERMQLFVPELDEELREELGFVHDGYFSMGGRIERFADIPSRFTAVDRNGYCGVWQHYKSVKELFFDRWMARGAESAYPAGENAVVFNSHAHGGNKGIDSPMAFYAVETLLQARKVSYLASYLINGQFRFFLVDEEGLHEMETDFLNSVIKAYH